MKKICGTARKLDMFFRILFYVIIVFAVLMVGVCVWLAVSGSDSITAGLDKAALMVNGISFDLTEQNVSDVDFRSVWILGSAMLIIAAGISCFAISIIRSILIPMKEGRPFADSVSGDFRKLGWLAIIGGVIYNIYDAVGKSLILNHIDFPENVVIGVTHEINVSFIIIAALLFLFAYVFRYGRELQQLSDETL